MRTVTFEFKEEKHLDFFVELLLTASLNYVEAKKQLDAENMSLRNAAPVRAERTLSAPSLSLDAKKSRKFRDLTDPEILPWSVDSAKQVMEREGYVFYKKPTNFGKNKPAGFGKKRKRIRRTKAQIEMDRQKEKVSE